MSSLPPLSEEPINEDSNRNKKKNIFSKRSGQSWRNWFKTQLLSPLLFNNSKKSDLKILLSVLGCPLSPVSAAASISPHPKHNTTLLNNNVETSAQYIIQHYTAATGCKKIEGLVKTVYATGTVTMAMTDQEEVQQQEQQQQHTTTTTTTSSSNRSSVITTSGVTHQGCFVVWQMVPDKWLMELVVSGHKISAGSDGKVAWRHTPWLGSHAAKGGVRPLRRALQGLDPATVAAVFSAAQFMGEKRMVNEDCFALKLSADQTVLVDRSDSTAETIKHVMVGYFSQRSGLLVYLEDSHLTRIQSLGANPTYWETTMGSKLEDYRTVDHGVMISHSGHSTVSLTRFGNNVKVGPLVKRMEERWTIDDVVFNVPGLSLDCFIPPEEVRPLDHHGDGMKRSGHEYWRSSSLRP